MWFTHPNFSRSDVASLDSLGDRLQCILIDVQTAKVRAKFGFQLAQLVNFLIVV